MDDTPPLIVVLEDDAGLRRAIERLLRLSGFRSRAFRCAEDPELADCVLSAYCLIIDIQLPGISGSMFYAALSAPRPPAVFITAFDGASARHALLGLGIHPLLNKPFLGSELLNAVSRAAGGRP